MTKSKMKAFTIGICILGDWIAAIYAYLLVRNGRELFEQMVKTMGQAQGINPEEFELSFITQLYEKAMTITTVTLVCLLALHMIFYFFYNREKTFALTYVKLLSWVGAIFYALFALTSLGSPAFAGLLIIQTALYIFVIVEHKKHPLKAGVKDNV